VTWSPREGCLHERVISDIQLSGRIHIPRFFPLDKRNSSDEGKRNVKRIGLDSRERGTTNRYIEAAKSWRATPLE